MSLASISFSKTTCHALASILYMYVEMFATKIPHNITLPLTNQYRSSMMEYVCMNKSQRIEDEK